MGCLAGFISYVAEYCGTVFVCLQQYSASAFCGTTGPTNRLPSSRLVTLRRADPDRYVDGVRVRDLSPNHGALHPGLGIESAGSEF